MRVALIAGLATLFGVSVVVLTGVLPEPHRPADYLVIGTLATFVCLGVLFVLNVTVGAEARDIFFKRRK